jgi:hypothetical protein
VDSVSSARDPKSCPNKLLPLALLSAADPLLLLIRVIRAIRVQIALDVRPSQRS